MPACSQCRGTFCAGLCSTAGGCTAGVPDEMLSTTCRASKTALNSLTRTMSLEFARRKQNVACIMLHPGTCDTDLSAPYQKVSHGDLHEAECCAAQRLLRDLAESQLYSMQNVKPEKLFTKDRAVKQLLGIIDSVTMAESGKFFAWDRQEVPW